MTVVPHLRAALVSIALAATLSGCLSVNDSCACQYPENPPTSDRPGDGKSSRS